MASPRCAVQADAFHRGHAIVEQVIAELKARPLAHLPSGTFSANAAWLAFAVMAFTISRAAAVAAGTGKARMATVARQIIATPARLEPTGRRLIMHLPTRWPWHSAWTNLWGTATSPLRNITDGRHSSTVDSSGLSARA